MRSATGTDMELGIRLCFIKIFRILLLLPSLNRIRGLVKRRKLTGRALKNPRFFNAINPRARPES